MKLKFHFTRKQMAEAFVSLIHFVYNIAMDSLIKTENLKVIYNRGKDNEFVALNGIDIEIFPEEYIIFFGPSGCGKSTLLYTILGLQPPSEGKVFINGRDTAEFTERDKNEQTSKFFGIIFQNFNLIYSLNVLDNITLPEVFIDKPLKQRKEVAFALLKRFGIETRAANLPGALSGGQQQRVAISRALANDPKVLLADEPVGNLDSESAGVVMNTLRDINRDDKKTIILVTHDPSYLSFADRIYYFKDAKIERMVKNRRGVPGGEPLKPGQAYEPVNELEKLARVHAYMNVPQLKAWSLTNYLIQELTLNQTERLERAMENLLAGKNSEHEFFEFLNKPYSEGGVGLYKTTAVHYTVMIGRILREVKLFVENAKILDTREQKEKLVALLKEFLLEEYKGELKPAQMERLQKVIYNRVFGVSTIDEFNRFLDWPLADGGVGLNIMTAERMAEKLEIILAQVYQAQK
ncbi:ATP-binding cassette domain-containing protein [Patescibacteria group bacterium]|nr:MAG: ATP-binding cassette domain-containing protein [Patescibacteria group bacterium]